MQFLLTHKEYYSLAPKKELEKMTAAAMTASIMLAEKVSRHHKYDVKGCVANGTADYCDNCLAVNFCPYEYKKWGV